MDTFESISEPKGYRLGDQSGYNAGEQAAAEPPRMREHSSKAQGLREYQSSRAEPQAMRAKRNRYRVRPQGLTSRTERATLRSIEQTKARYSTKHGSRIGCETISECAARSPRGLARCEAQDARGSRSDRARVREGARSREGTHTGEAGSASGRRVSRMSAPNLGAHRTPTRPSRQHATYSGFTEF